MLKFKAALIVAPLAFFLSTGSIFAEKYALILGSD